jgi:hypothetical protein
VARAGGIGDARSGQRLGKVAGFLFALLIVEHAHDLHDVARAVQPRPAPKVHFLDDLVTQFVLPH